MGKFVQNNSMDLLISIIVYFDPNIDLAIKSSKNFFNNSGNDTLFTGKVKDFNILKIESGEISFAESFYILSMIPDKNKITFFIYEE